MNSAVLLAEENRQLRSENERQKKKRAKEGFYSYWGRSDFTRWAG
jgi:hypothetical protein